MSLSDKKKWQNRYREGAYAERLHPSPWLVTALQHADIVPDARALDLACGAGRNAIYLAQQGYQVDAVDIASEALRQGSARAAAESVQGISWIEHDLDEPLSEQFTGYQLIIMMRYLDLDVLRAVADRLVPWGILVCEVHLQTDQPVAGPSSQQFRAEPGALKAAVAGLDVLEYFEGLPTDPDGSTVAVARVVGRKK